MAGQRGIVLFLSFRGKELHYKISPFDITKPQLHPPSNGPGLEIPVIGARAKTAHSHYGSLPISSPIRCVALSPLPVKIITVVSADRMTPASRSLLSAAAPLAEVGST